MDEKIDERLSVLAKSKYPLASEITISREPENHVTISVIWHAHDHAGEKPIWGRTVIPDDSLDDISVLRELDAMGVDLFAYFQLTFIAGGSGAAEVVDRYTNQFLPTGALGRMPAMDKLSSLPELAEEFINEKKEFGPK